MFNSQWIQPFKKILSILVSSSRQYRYARHLDELTVAEPLPLEGITFEWVNEENVDLIREWKGPLYAWKFRTLLNRGYLGQYALADGKVVSYQWTMLKLSPHSLACSQTPLEVGDAFHHRTETRRTHRRLGLGLYLQSMVTKYLQDHYRAKGIKRVGGAVQVGNEPMQRLLTKFGVVRREEILAVIILGHLFIYYIWDLRPGTTERQGKGRLAIRLKVPDLFWLPAFNRPRPGQRDSIQYAPEET